MGEPIYWPSFLFLLCSAIACVFAVAVLLATNIVRMAFYLVVSLSATAGLFFLAGADFVGAMLIIFFRIYIIRIRSCIWMSINCMCNIFSYIRIRRCVTKS